MILMVNAFSIDDDDQQHDYDDDRQQYDDD